MRLWWIKLSRTTSVRFVNLRVNASLYAQIANQFLLLGCVWALVSFDTPLALSTYLFILILCCQMQGGFVASSTRGSWYLHRDGTVRNDKQTSIISSVDISAAVFKVTFELASGERVTIWRDSCDDVVYRQLCLILRQWKMGAEAPI
ncbi:protein YgfX [Vibrio sp. AND4]|uniref:protein YgfX n=1 Tax=Vibrio sp. AND4 TaxID=314289 RepID=UPI0030D7BC27